MLDDSINNTNLSDRSYNQTSDNTKIDQEILKNLDMSMPIKNNKQTKIDDTQAIFDSVFELNDKLKPKKTENISKDENVHFRFTENNANKENSYDNSNFNSEKQKKSEKIVLNQTPVQNKNYSTPPISKENDSSVKFVKKNTQETSFENVVIPSNLKMKDEHLPYFCDLQNVLILFSEMKSRVDTLAKEKVKIQEANEILKNTNKKVQSDLENSENGKRILFQN